MDAAQFGTGRYAYFFKPGQYALDVQVGFYTQVLGLGTSPDDVTITGAVRAKADWLGNDNATCNFWRGAENFAVVPTQAIDSGIDVWATAQGTAIRRAHVRGTIVLDDNGGWASGGFIADSKIDTQIQSGSQQQYLTRNVDLTSWQGSNWNMVFVGDGQAPHELVAGAAVHHHRRDAADPREAVPLPRRSGDYLVMVPALTQRHPGVELGERRAARERGVHRPLLPRQAGHGHGREPQRRARAGQAPAPHARHLPPRERARRSRSRARS